MEKISKETVIDGDTFNVEVGDYKQIDFYNQVKIMRWDNECNFSMRLVEDYECIYYEKEGAYEFEVKLLEKPKNNILNFTVQSKEVELLYQPELTQKQIDAGDERPDNVVGSYAIYHKSKAYNNYKAGKAFHIYRPEAIDSLGEKVWCDLAIQEETATITIPQEFLDHATYPIWIDPTFGYTSAGGSSGALEGSTECSGCREAAYQYAASTGDTITKFSVYCRTYSTGGGGLASYTISSLIPVTKTGATGTWVAGSVGWQDTGAVSIALANGVTYGVAWGEITGSPRVYYDSATDGTSRDTRSATFPATWSEELAGATRYSMYATYTEGGAGTNMEANIGDAWKTITGIEINIGDAWKAVTGVEINVGDTWKTVF